MVTTINVVSTNTTLVRRTPPSYFMVYCEKPEKFNGLNFKRWYQKILSNLTTFNLAKFVIEKVLMLSNKEYDPIPMVVVDARNCNYFLCTNYILNRLDNTLYDMSSLIKSV